MGPFIAKKETISEEGGRNTRLRRPPAPPRTRIHRGEWNRGETAIICRDCGDVFAGTGRWHDEDAVRDWINHQHNAPRMTY